MIKEQLAQYNLATRYLEKKKYDKGISEFKKLLKTFPCKEGYLNLGNCYRMKGDEIKAVQNFREAGKVEVPFLDGKTGEYPLAINNIGLSHYASGLTDSAIKLYRRALELDPKYTDAAWNLSSALLKKACSGDASVEREGLDLYESRFIKSPPVKLHVDVPGLKFWDGKRVRKLVILAEQGIGDQFMWARYLPLAAKMCDELIVQCDHTLADTFKLAGHNTCFSLLELGIDTTLDAGLPMCSLSRAFGILPDGGEWLKGLVGTRELENNGLPNIGIVWEGSSTHANNHNRSVAIHRFHKLAKYANLYSLKPGFKSTKYVRGLPISNWMDTLEYINSMDLIISVDTSVAHAAGSLGARTWMLQPSRETDFRWGEDSFGSKNAWYSSVRIYRNSGDWGVVFDQVEEDLIEEV